MEENKEVVGGKNSEQNKQMPQRDEKGQFISPNGASASKKRKSKKQKEQEAIDANTVKIRIVKDEEPMPGTDYEGRLEDMKERTATNFIKAVSIRKPKCISIDGNFYYALSELDALRYSLDEAKRGENRALSKLKQINDYMSSASNALDEFEKDLVKDRRSRFIWNCVVIGIFVACVSFAIGEIIGKHKAMQPNPDAPVAQVDKAK